MRRPPPHGEPVEYDVFLNYAREETDWCLRLVQRLHDAGVRVWLDLDVPSGADVRRQVDAALLRVRKMVAVWTPRYFAKDWTLDEIYSMQNRETAERQELIIPILREHSESIPPLLTRYNTIDFRDLVAGTRFCAGEPCRA